MATKRDAAWVPDRQDIIWIDCNPQKGREMRDVHPFLVLSPHTFNDRTSLVIGLPMTTRRITRITRLPSLQAWHPGESLARPVMSSVISPSRLTGASDRRHPIPCRSWMTHCFRKC